MLVRVPLLGVQPQVDTDPRATQYGRRYGFGGGEDPHEELPARVGARLDRSRRCWDAPLRKDPPAGRGQLDSPVAEQEHVTGGALLDAGYLAQRGTVADLEAAAGIGEADLGDAQRGLYARSPLERFGALSILDGDEHLCPAGILPGRPPELLVSGGEQGLQRDRPGHGDRHAVDQPGRGGAVELEAPYRELPRDAA